MSAPTVSNADVAALGARFRDVLKTGAVTKITGHDCERVLACLSYMTTGDRSAMTDFVYDDALDGRPAVGEI